MSSYGDAAHLWYLAIKLFVSSLSPSERLKLAAAYLRKVPSRYRLYLAKKFPVFDLVVNEVFLRKIYGH